MVWRGLPAFGKSRAPVSIAPSRRRRRTRSSVAAVRSAHVRTQNWQTISAGKYPESISTRRDEAEFQKYNLITKVIANSLDFESIELAGRLTRIAYDNPQDRSALEILANYQQAIVGAGGTVIYLCQEKECGPAYAGSRWGRYNGTINLPGVGGYVAGKITSGENTAYIAIGVAKRRHQITIVEVQEMETGLVEIDPEALGQELDRLGHVAIRGVFFETGKAALTPESQEALLAEI